MYTQILVAGTAVIFLIYFLFGWMYANVDSYFYYAIGEYFRSGVYPFIEPFIYTKPTTISPPLYGLFFTFTHNIPHAEILLHAIQLLLLALTSFLLYKVLQNHIAKYYALLIACLFALLPVNLIYASSVMTENPAQFFVMLWVYLMTQKTPLAKSLAFLMAVIGGLLKYNLMIFAVFSLMSLFFKKSSGKIPLLFPGLAAIVFISWIFINHQITGTWGLYDTHGTQFYNQFIAQTKLLPPESAPSVIRMRSLLPPGTDIAVPYWDIQKHLADSLNNEWKQIDVVLFNVAWASIKIHPLDYLFHSIKNFALLHYSQIPHWENVGNMGLVKTGVLQPFCGVLGSVETCKPIIFTPWSYTIWNAFIGIEINLFKLLSFWGFYIIFIPALLSALVKKNIYAIMYLVGVIPIAFTIHPDSRYIIPFYPLIVLIVVASSQHIASYIVAHIGNRNHKNNRDT